MEFYENTYVIYLSSKMHRRNPLSTERSLLIRLCCFLLTLMNFLLASLNATVKIILKRLVYQHKFKINIIIYSPANVFRRRTVLHSYFYHLKINVTKLKNKNILKSIEITKSTVLVYNHLSFTMFSWEFNFNSQQSTISYLKI